MSLFFQRVGGFKYFLFSPLGKIPILTTYFSKGLVQPPTRFCFIDFLNGVVRPSRKSEIFRCPKQFWAVLYQVGLQWCLSMARALAFLHGCTSRFLKRCCESIAPVLLTLEKWQSTFQNGIWSVSLAYFESVWKLALQLRDGCRIKLY